MNKLQKLSAGLVLLFGGDGPAAQRAGDALLADRIDEAVQEGGFSSIRYSAWRKSPDSATRLGFDDIELAKDAGTVRVADSEMDVFTHALDFRRGEFSWAGRAHVWSFETVELIPAGWFSSALRIEARDLVRSGALASVPPCEDRPGDVDESGRGLACVLANIGADPIEYFWMAFTPRRADAVVTVAWQVGSECYAVWTPDGHGSDDFATWGSRFLDRPAQVDFELARTDCAPLGLAEDDTMVSRALISGAQRSVKIPGDALVAADEVLVRTLFGLVAESWRYLLE